MYAVEFLRADAPPASSLMGEDADADADADAEDGAPPHDNETKSEGSEQAEIVRGSCGRECGERADFSAGYFATGSKDHTIAIWDLFADTFKE